MAVYKLFNPSYRDTIQFSSVFDYNNIECLTITPRATLTGTNDLLGPYSTSIDYGRTRLIKDIFDFATKYPGRLEITKDGQPITYANYQAGFA